MNKIFETISGEVDEAMLQKFINIQKNQSDDTEITIFFESDWGNTSMGESIIHVINNTKNITLIGQNEILSAGFDIFFFSKCKKKVNKVCTGMCHIWSFSVSTNHYRRKGKASGETLCKIKNVEELSIYIAKFYKKELWMSKKNVKAYLQDYDVYFSKKRLQKLIDFQNYK